jgi:nucleoside-diphosphate-sugar epimerase
MKSFTILGTGWLGLELAHQLKNQYNVKVSARNEEKSKFFKNLDFLSFVLNEYDFSFLDKLLDTNYLFINYPPSKFDDYLGFLNKIYKHENIKNIEKIIFISSTSIYPNVEGRFDENYIINDSSSKMVFEAEKVIENKSDVIFRVSGLVGGSRYFGKRSANKVVESPQSVINFVHRNDVINATKFIIEKNINGIFNLCSKEHPTKKEIYTFNSKKYNFEIPIFLDNKSFLNRVIDGSKIEKLGFEYKYNNVFEF